MAFFVLLLLLSEQFELGPTERLDKIVNRRVKKLILLLGLDHARPLRTQVRHRFVQVNVALYAVRLYLVDDHVNGDDGTRASDTGTLKSNTFRIRVGIR